MIRRLLLLVLLLGALPAPGLTIPPDSEILQTVRSVLQNKGETVQRTIKRAGDKTIQFEAFIATEGDLAAAKEIFSDYRSYSSWALNNINRKPGGGTYYMQILGLNPDPVDKNLLNLSFQFDLPLFHQKLDRTFRLKVETQGGNFLLTGQSVPKEGSPIASAEGFVKIFPAEKKPGMLWIYIKGFTHLRHWVLYEALPDRLLARESGERIQIVVDNYRAEEDRRLKLNQIPKEKKAAPAQKTASQIQK